MGKTFVVREFGKKEFKNIVEINFDRNPEKKQLFLSRDVKDVIKLLEVEYSTTIVPGETLLFLDEIQAAPEVFPRLRYFYEDFPELHVVSAGSLLEFLLGDHSFSMPVGRIEYLHLGPMTFEEFLLAAGEKGLHDYCAQYSLSEKFPPSLHDKLSQLFKIFIVIGGMPKVVANYAGDRDFKAVAMEHESILQSYVDDFAKYAPKTDTMLLRKVFGKIPGILGKKVKYVLIDQLEKSKNIKQALEQLEMAKVLYRVMHSAANGVPLGAESKESDFKLLFLDVGLVTTALGLKASDIVVSHDVALVNEGALAEQFIGQHLLYASEPFRKPELYYWNRQTKNSSAELDYVISLDAEIIPVEVKSGRTGSLKSLNVFVEEKQKRLALRFNADFPSVVETKSSSSTRGQPFHLVSLPLYMVCQAKRILAQQFESLL